MTRPFSPSRRIAPPTAVLPTAPVAGSLAVPSIAEPPLRSGTIPYRPPPITGGVTGPPVVSGTLTRPPVSGAVTGPPVVPSTLTRPPESGAVTGPPVGSGAPARAPVVPGLAAPLATTIRRRPPVPATAMLTGAVTGRPPSTGPVIPPPVGCAARLTALAGRPPSVSAAAASRASELPTLTAVRRRPTPVSGGAAVGGRPGGVRSPARGRAPVAGDAPGRRAARADGAPAGPAGGPCLSMPAAAELAVSGDTTPAGMPPSRSAGPPAAAGLRPSVAALRSAGRTGAATPAALYTCLPPTGT